MDLDLRYSIGLSALEDDTTEGESPVNLTAFLCVRTPRVGLFGSTVLSGR